MARMPVLAGGLLMVGMALTAGCQSTSAKKPNQTPTPPYTKNNQVGGGNPNLANADPFPRTPPPSPTPKVQPVSGAGNFNSAGPNLNNPNDPSGMPSPYIVPTPTNRITQPGVSMPPDPVSPPSPALGGPGLPAPTPFRQ